MSEQEQTVQVTFTRESSVELGCGQCGTGSQVARVFIDLPSASVVVGCTCGTLIARLGLSIDAYRQAVLVKLGEGEESRIVKPAFGKPS